ncbi:MAG: AraC family transcriptional regulator [Proteiniphilum sp.]
MTERIADGFKNEKAIILPYNVRDYLKINSVTRHLHVTHIGYYPEAKYHFRERKNGADQNILIYCESGKGWIIYNGEKIYLERNQIFILPANEAHAYGADTHDPWSIYWIHFKGEDEELFSSIIGKKTDTGESHSGRIEDRLVLFEEIYQNLDMGYNPENLEYTSCCLSYFLASIKYVTQFREIKNTKEIDIIQKSIIFMKNNLEQSIDLEDIAQHIGYSPSHFGNLFQKKTSYSPMGYYNQLKIQRACSYLQFSDLKIKEIAFRLGYYDPFHFSKAFKKETRLTPKEYRKKYNP